MSPDCPGCGPATRVPPLPREDVWSSDRASLWEGVRVKGLHAWRQPPGLSPLWAPDRKPSFDGAHHQRCESEVLRVRPLRVHRPHRFPGLHTTHAGKFTEGELFYGPGLPHRRRPGGPPPPTIPESCRAWLELSRPNALACQPDGHTVRPNRLHANRPHHIVACKSLNSPSHALPLRMVRRRKAPYSR